MGEIMPSSINCQKIVVLGSPNVGKTSIIQRYVHNLFKDSYAATLGFNIYTRYVMIADKQVGLSIWDVGGQEAFRKFAFRYLIEADAAIFVADVTKPETIDDLVTWNEKLEEIMNRKIPKIILFNKIDMDYDMTLISDRLAKSKVRTEFHGIVFASAKTGQNIIDIFSMIAKMLTGWNETFGVPQKQMISFNGAFEERTLPIVFFTNDNCTWCKPVFDCITSLSAEFPLDIKVIDVDFNKDLASEYGIQSLPTTFIGNKTVVGDSDEKIFRAIITDEYFRLFSEKIR